MKKTPTLPANKHQTHVNNAINRRTRALLKLWRANREFRMRDIQFEDYEKLGKEFDNVSEKIDALNRELIQLRKERDKLEARLIPLNAQAHSGMRGYFGLHSPELAQIKT